uniref:GYD domain superfamily n=1 Tax=Acetithermum autotrophicum TaxID=1446466 RepID=H5SR89_ACEAU|nr:GYD domain superfamily [Candidatus Acetothermum autotrophicum]
MPTYILLSSLTDEGAQAVKKRPGRIKEVNREIERMGCTILSQYAVLGPYDFVTILEAPDNKTVLKVSLELGARGSVKIQTLAAIPIDEFIKGLK